MAAGTGVCILDLDDCTPPKRLLCTSRRRRRRGGGGCKAPELVVLDPALPCWGVAADLGDWYFLAAHVRRRPGRRR